MELEYGDPPLIHNVRVDLAVTIFIRDHLPATVEVHERAVVSTALLLEPLAIRALGKSCLLYTSDAADE